MRYRILFGMVKGNSEINYWLWNVYIVFSRRSNDEVTTSPASQEVNSAFVRYLDDGYWYLSFYNDGPKSQNIRYLLLLWCDIAVLIEGVGRLNWVQCGKNEHSLIDKKHLSGQLLSNTLCVCLRSRWLLLIGIVSLFNILQVLSMNGWMAWTAFWSFIPWWCLMMWLKLNEHCAITSPIGIFYIPMEWMTRLFFKQYHGDRLYLLNNPVG